MAEDERARRSGWLWLWLALFVIAILIVILWAWPARQPPEPAADGVSAISMEQGPPRSGPAAAG